MCMQMSGWQVGVLLVMAIPAAPFLGAAMLCNSAANKWRQSYTRDKVSTTWARVHRTREAFTYRAICYYAREDKADKVFRVLDMALEADPNYIPALYLKANILTENGRYAEAVPVFTHLIQVWQGATPAPASAADGSSSSSSSSSSSEAAAVEPAVYVSHSANGRTYVLHGERSLDVQLSEAWNNQGKCHYELGHYPAALEAFSQSHRLAGFSWLLRFNLARTHFELGNIDEAVLQAIHAVNDMWNLNFQFEEIIAVLTWRLQLWTSLQRHVSAEIDRAVIQYFEPVRSENSNSYYQWRSDRDSYFARFTREEVEQIGYSID